MQLQFQIFPNYLFMQLQFFFPELILHKYSVEGYCGQLQYHVRIATFRRSNRQITMLGKASYFFLVLRHGGEDSKSTSGGTLCIFGSHTLVQRYCELAHKTTQQLYKVSTPCIDDHHFKEEEEEETKSVGELSNACSQIVLKCLNLARVGRPDILWSVNKLERSITKWTEACDKRQNRLISYIRHTCEYRQYCHVGNTAKQCRLGLFQDFDFAGDREDSKSTSGGT